MKRDYTIGRNLLDGVETFLRVAARRSFKGAADDLGVSPSAVSQAVRQLEARIGVPLFIRTTRAVGLTEAGALFQAQAAPAWAGLVAGWDSARNLGERPAGLLRLNMPRAVVRVLIEPIIAEFCRRYPDVDVDIVGEDALMDLATNGHDAGIRIGELLEADMISVRLSAPFRFIIVGSPGYFEAHGRPQALADLKNHSCVRQRISNAGVPMSWRLTDGNRSIEVAAKGRVIVNDNITAAALAERGLGLVQISEPLVATQLADNRLEEVLQQFAPTSPGLFLHYPSHRQMSPKLRAFIDHVKLAVASGTLPAMGHIA